MSYNEIGCRECGALRPRWHGGRHKCLHVGVRIQSALNAPWYPIQEQELGFLRVPGPVA
jgi:hypothetical protein